MIGKAILGFVPLWAWAAIGAAIIAGAGAYHWSAVSNAHAAGKAEVQALWSAADKVAEAVGVAKTNLLGRAAIRETEKLHDRLTKMASLAATRGAELARRAADSVGLQQRATESTAEADRRAASTPTGSDERRIASCERLLGEADRLAAEIDGVAEPGRAALQRLQEVHDSMKAWARLVQSAGEAP